MKIFLSGGSGMVGQNILGHNDFNKHTIYAPNSSELDLLDKQAVADFLNDAKPNLIIHAAGHVGGIQANIANPVKFLRNNINIGMNIISEAYASGIPNLINLASSCMYPRNASNPLKENLILTGELEPTNEGYALSKIVSTRLCEYINLEDKTKNYKTIIPCNLYGKFDKFGTSNSHLIPAVIKKVYEAIQNNEKSVEIWGDGSARREFMSASDLADFIYFITDKIELMPQNLNVGLGYDYSIKQYYEAVSKVLNYEGEFSYNLSRPVGMKQKLVDVEQLKTLGWKPKTDLLEGIQEAFNYYISKKDQHGI
ncbi:NAD-dependent epimerase/dehydratase family protein [Gammaproteobacteria bacterium]|nr:NAD-dependent epimerase/dehydratase family protein [Gammaproteobacteria bacterium]